MIRWKRADILSQYSDRIDYKKLTSRREAREALLDRPHWEQVRSLLMELSDPEGQPASFSPGATVSVGSEETLRNGDADVLTRTIKAMLPWRKGPFSICGQEIDAEWRSDYKWNRIKPHLNQVHGKRILDIGCNNGYYMFRLAEDKPRLVVGVDPGERCWYQFELLQRYAKDPALVYELCGVNELDVFPGIFDVVLCMGIIYHHRNPLEMLERVQDTMIPGGQLILESIAIPETGSHALCPPDRYAKMRNVYFIPTPECLEIWMQRAGFVDIRQIAFDEVTEEEQRSTPLAPYWSLKDYLDPADSSRTVEGYPAPWRVAVSARKPRK